MKISLILFFSVLILSTFIMQYAFFWFNKNITNEYPLGKFPDAKYHFTNINAYYNFTHIQDKDAIKYYGTYIIFFPLLIVSSSTLVFNILIPILYIFILPIAIFFMAQEYTKDTFTGIIAALIFLFGTDVVTTIFQIAVWPQGMNMLLSALAIGTGIRYIRSKKIMFLILSIFLLIWSAFAHLKFAIISFVIAITFIGVNKRYLEMFLLTLAVSLSLFVFRTYYQFNLVSNDFFINPLMLLFTVFPINFIAGLYGLYIKNKDKQRINMMIIIPLLISIFLLLVDPNFRFYMYILMFMSPFMAIGIISLAKKISNAFIMKIIVIVYMITMMLYFLMFCMYLSYVDIIQNAYQYANYSINLTADKNGNTLQRLRIENSNATGMAVGP